MGTFNAPAVAAGFTSPTDTITVGSGGTTDQTDIKTAIEAATAGQTVLVYPGTYTITAKITVADTVSIISVGGSAVTTITFSTTLGGGTAEVITFGAGGVMKGITWDYTGASDPTHSMINSGTGLLVMEDVICLTTGNGKMHFMTEGSDSVTLINCGCTMELATAIVGSGSAGTVTVRGGVFTATSGSGTGMECFNAPTSGKLRIHGGEYIALFTPSNSCHFLKGNGPDQIVEGARVDGWGLALHATAGVSGGSTWAFNGCHFENITAGFGFFNVNNTGSNRMDVAFKGCTVFPTLDSTVLDVVSAPEEIFWDIDSSWNITLRVTAATQTVSGNVMAILCDRAGTIGLTLCEGEQHATGDLLITDISGAAGSNTITITPAATETVGGGGATTTITTNDGSVRLRWNPDDTDWMIVATV